MIHLVLFSVSLVSAFFAVARAESSTGAFDAAAARTRCTTHHSQSERLYRSTFSWHPGVQAMRETFEEVYDSGRRMPFHADYNTEKESFCLYVRAADGVKPVRVGYEVAHPDAQ